MKSLEFRKIIFVQDGRGKIEDTTKGTEVVVSREDLKEMIKKDPSIIGVEIPALDMAKNEQSR